MAKIRLNFACSCFFGIAAFSLAAPMVQANDSSFEGVAGSVRPLKGENRFIRMESEKVVLTANANDFTTQADFVFRNDSARSLSVPMGFPEGNYGDVASAGPLAKSGFSFFSTWVDGQKVSARRVILGEKEAENADFDTYWLKTVTFAPHQTRRVRVIARSPYGGRAAWGLQNALSYEFTGQNWKGNVSRSDLEVHIPRKGLWTAVMTAGEKPLDFTIAQTGEMAILKRSWKNWPAQLSLTVGLTKAIPFWRATPESVRADNINGQLFRTAKTFRVGAKPAGLENYAEFAPDGFARDGIEYISLSSLQNQLNRFAYEKNLKLRIESGYDTKARFYFLREGPNLWRFKLESRAVTLLSSTGSQKVFALPASPILLRGGSDSTLYVPLYSVAKALSITAKVDDKNRLLTLSPDNWPKE